MHASTSILQNLNPCPAPVPEHLITNTENCRVRKTAKLKTFDSNTGRRKEHLSDKVYIVYLQHEVMQRHSVASRGQYRYWQGSEGTRKPESTRRVQGIQVDSETIRSSDKQQKYNGVPGLQSIPRSFGTGLEEGMIKDTKKFSSGIRGKSEEQTGNK